MAPIPKTMKGVEIETTGGPEVLQYKTDLPVPTPKEGQILVKNAYAGINYIDTYFRTGLYPAPKPEILGRDAEGEVVAVGPGNVYGLKVGDYVVWMGSGSYAEFSAAPAEKAVKVPKGLSPGQACAAILQGLTALTIVRESYTVQKGDWILIHAAAGGVGLWLCQILKAIGAHTIGTASTADKIALAKENGAEHMVNYHEDGLEAVVKEVKKLTDGKGVAAVFDSVGKTTFDISLECLARKGTFVSFGNASGAVPPLTIARLSAKNIKILRPTLFQYIVTREEFETYADELFDMMLKDNMAARVHKEYPLADVQQAHKDLEGRVTTGKLLLIP